MKINFRHIILFISIIIFLVAGLSFQNKEEKAPLTPKERMDQILDERINNYRNSFISDCAEDALNDALIYVDSIIRTPGFIFKYDSIVPPRPPSKPSKPNFGKGEYEEVKPIFQE
jgi:hypothetical protein